jgi:diguanylate cyclase (GGDEF)-like protein
MGQISGGLWIVGAMVGIAGAFLPGASHADLVWVLLLSGIALAYGIAGITLLIPWQRMSTTGLAIGAALTIPVVGLAIYLTGGSVSYIQPLLVCSLLYAGFFFPPAWAWPLTIELILVAGTPLLYEANEAIDTAFLSRYLAFATAFLTVTGVLLAVKRRLVDAEARQRQFANLDSLTGIANRRAFDSALRRELAARAEPNGGRRDEDREPFALLVIDLDDFKAINDDYGHQVGDAVLCDVAERARSVLRSTDTLARIGGDEFAVIAPGAHGDNILALGETLRDAIGAHRPGARLPTSRASLGAAVYPEDGETFETLMRVADRRLLGLKNDNGHSARGRGSGVLRLL